MKTIAILLVLATASLANAQYDSEPPIVPGTHERLARLEKDQNAMMARQARMESDIADSKEVLRLISDKLDAMAKAQGGSFASTKVWDGQAISFSAGQVQPAQMGVGYSGYSSMGAMQGRSRGRIFSRPLIGRLGGGCASGG